MKPEDKELLIQDLCERLPYQVKVSVNGGKEAWTLKGMFEGEHTGMMLILEPSFPSKDVSPQTSNWPLSQCKPYLRPMSSMTEEEKKEYQSLCVIYSDHDADDNVTYYYFDTVESFDWLNKKMFDYRGLIPAGSAIAVNEKNNPYKD